MLLLLKSVFQWRFRQQPTASAGASPRRSISIMKQILCQKCCRTVKIAPKRLSAPILPCPDCHLVSQNDTSTAITAAYDCLSARNRLKRKPRKYGIV